MSALLAALIALCTIWQGPNGPVLHKRIRHLGGVAYLHKVEVNIDAVVAITGAPRFLVATLAHKESGFDPYARSSVGARGLLQLLPGTPHYREWRRVCTLSPADCNQANLLIGARELMWSWRICGAGWEEAVARYRGAGCVPRPIDRDVVEQADQLRLSSLDLLITHGREP